MNFMCQACELHSANVEEGADDAVEPYRVCGGCNSRLLSRSLRPREWFNLAKRHGPAKFLLHDDFYDDDGIASQPEDEVDQADRFPAPTLGEACQQAASLLDYSVTRWQLDEPVCTAWTRLPPDDVLAALVSRFDKTRNPTVRSVVLEVVALIGAPGATLVRRAWHEWPEYGAFAALLQATAACLPVDEGLQRAFEALASMQERDRRQAFGALAHFRSERVLDWIEANAGEPSVEAWGYLAAACSFGWPRAERWLRDGRPLSLIAVDALLAIARPRTAFLRKVRPVLGNPPSEHELREAIRDMMQSDPVPRVKQRADALLALVPELVDSRLGGEAGKVEC
ncbi:hypothetical protein M8A51_18690 [Schlegelella sp. S2-27]|uniref:HEAT repeat domain-containing protein n=1 Tax=Caldimonas mangrovi TaxID=2944811 RepID=A0ABT0YTG4_9BURK|nr:hypothetical protein [Caldimonas mangrovi]MCM5681557.1 hypothetical protein [Caldimonas mangrovi]